MSNKTSTLGCDQILKQWVKGFGRWHIVFIITIVISSSFPLEFLSQFVFVVPHHYCRQPYLERLSWDKNEIINLSIPLKEDPQEPPEIGQTHHPCLEYNLDALWKHLNINSSLTDALLLRSTILTNLSTRSCKHGVTFDTKTDVIQNSLGKEFRIFCEQKYLIQLSNTLYFFGMLVGLALSGPLADRFGRRVICLLTPVATIISGVGTALANNVWVYIALRFITSMTTAISYITAITLGSEWMTEHQRNLFSFIRSSYFGIVARGIFIFFFYVMPSWRLAYGTIFVFVLPVIGGYFVWLESPRWLLSRGRLDEAHIVILRVISINGRKISSVQKNDLRNELKDIQDLLSEKDTDTFDIDEARTLKETEVKGRKMSSLIHTLTFLFINGSSRKRILLLLFLWLIEGFIYFGLSFNAVRLAGNPFLTSWLSSLLVAPGSLLQYLLYHFFDRKWPIAALLGVSSIATLTGCILIWTKVSSVYAIAAATIGLLMADAVFTMLFVRTPEILSTNVRSTGFGLCVGSSRIGMIMAANVERLDEMLWPPLPMLLFSIAAVLGAITSGFLPPGRGEMEEIMNTQPSMRTSGVKFKQDDIDKARVNAIHENSSEALM